MPAVTASRTFAVEPRSFGREGELIDRLIEEVLRVAMAADRRLSWQRGQFQLTVTMAAPMKGRPLPYNQADLDDLPDDD